MDVYNLVNGSRRVPGSIILGHHQWVVVSGGMFWSKSLFLLAKEGWDTPISRVLRVCKEYFAAVQEIDGLFGLVVRLGVLHMVICSSLQTSHWVLAVLAEGCSEQRSLSSHVS